MATQAILFLALVSFAHAAPWRCIQVPDATVCFDKWGPPVIRPPTITINRPPPPCVGPATVYTPPCPCPPCQPPCGPALSPYCPCPAPAPCLPYPCDSCDPCSM